MNGVVSKNQMNDEVCLFDTLMFDTTELFELDRVRFMSITVMSAGIK